MPGLSKLGDPLIPHGCWTPHNLASGSNNVLVNGMPAANLGTPTTLHCQPCVKGIPCHVGVQSSGSNSVLINGLPAARLGDNISCGSINAAGSTNVIAN